MEPEKIFLAILLASICFSCKPSGVKGTTKGQGEDMKMAYAQGIKGQVIWFEGNLMPGPGRDLPTGVPVEREVYIFEVVQRKGLGLAGQNSLYDEIPAKLVDKVKSGPDGNFEIGLPPGKYSLFTKEDKGFFANRYDGEGNVFPVEVIEGKFEQVNIQINYKAVY